MDKMLDEKMLSDRRISDAELLGIFEMVFDHVLPFHELFHESAKQSNRQ